MFFYQIYLGFKNEEYQEGRIPYVTAYLDEIDTPWNYIYLILISVWSTVFVESWKRKQNTIKYLWALEEKRQNI